MVAVAGRPHRPAAFFLNIAGVLAAGELSALGSDRGARIFYLLLAWLAPVTIHFYVALLGRSPGREEHGALLAFWLFALIGSVPPAIWPFAAAQQYAWFGLWRASVRLGFVVAFLVVTVWLVRDYRQRASLAAQRRIRLVAFGTLFAFAPLFLFSLLPDTLNGPAYVPYEYTFPWLLLSPLSYGYARFRHRLVRTETVLRRALVYYLLTVVLFSLSLAAMWVLDHLRTGTPDEWLRIGVVLSIGVALVFVPLQQVLQRVVTWILYGHEIGDPEVIARLAASLARMSDRETLRRLLVEDLASAMRLPQVALLLRDAKQDLAPLPAIGFDNEMLGRCRVGADSSLMRYLEAEAGPVTGNQVRHALLGVELQSGERALLELAHAALWLPLLSNGVLQGFLLVGVREEDAFFTAEDRRLLSLVAYQAGIAAHNIWLLEAVRAKQEQLAGAHRQSLIEREHERLRLARELHDNALQQLLGVSRLLEVMESRGKNERRVGMRAVEELTLADLRQEILKVAGQLRELSAELRPAWLNELGLAAALRAEVERQCAICCRDKPRVELELVQCRKELPEATATCLFRVAQEALRNAMEHARARQIELRLLHLEGDIVLQVRDDGCGFRVPIFLSALVQAGHFGLAGMAEQVERIGGKLDIRSRPGEGTEVTVRVRLSPSA